MCRARRAEHQSCLECRPRCGARRHCLPASGFRTDGPEHAGNVCFLALPCCYYTYYWLSNPVKSPVKPNPFCRIASPLARSLLQLYLPCRYAISHAAMPCPSSVGDRAPLFARHRASNGHCTLRRCRYHLYARTAPCSLAACSASAPVFFSFFFWQRCDISRTFSWHANAVQYNACMM